MKKAVHDFDESGHILLVAVGIIVVGVIGWTAWYVHERHTHASNVSSTNSQTSSGGSAKATDNASLNSDLNNVNGSINQESRDDGAAGTALNDQQNEVQVPLN